MLKHGRPRGLALAMLLALLAGCTEEPPTVRLAPISGGAEEPTMLFEGFRMTSTRDAAVEWEFAARSAQIYEKIHLAKAQDIKVTYWQKGRVVSTLTARRGVIDTENNDMRAEEQVEMVSAEGVRLTTERLNWSHSQQRLYTDLPVRVVRRNSVLTGVGMEADSELKHINVLAEVKITVPSLQDLDMQDGKP
ncbi:MAG: LPS export ABC transporter periplasmic protein LptC [candidate division FCPU426 bacterium]